MRLPAFPRTLSTGLLLGAALALGACDSGEPGPGPDGAPAFVGVWAPDSVTARTLGTATRDIVVVDLSRPGTGTLAVSGETTAPLRYVGTLQLSDDWDEVTLTSSDPGEAPVYPHVWLTLRNHYGEASLGVVHGNGSTEYYDSYGHTAPLYTYAAGRLSVPPLVLTDWGSDTVTVNGTLDLVTRSIRANTEGVLYSETHPFYFDSEAMRYVFDEGGAFHIDEITGDVTRRHTGTWERIDDTRVRVAIPWEGGTETTVFTVRREGDVLTLTYTERSCEEETCLGYVTGEYRLDAGSLSTVRWEYTYRFTPEEAARPAAGAPSGSAARDLLWPRRPAAN